MVAKSRAPANGARPKIGCDFRSALVAAAASGSAIGRASASISTAAGRASASTCVGCASAGASTSRTFRRATAFGRTCAGGAAGSASGGLTCHVAGGRSAIRRRGRSFISWLFRAAVAAEKRENRHRGDRHHHPSLHCLL